MQKHLGVFIMACAVTFSCSESTKKTTPSVAGVDDTTSSGGTDEEKESSSVEIKDSDNTPDPIPSTSPSPNCKNGRIDADESCEDGNNVPGDGCSENCVIEAGFDCPGINAPCVRKLLCGDGVVSASLGEKCDDKNTESGDGCSNDCLAVETNFACLVPGESCTSTVVCGDGKIEGVEVCDDRNTVSGDGCSKDCLVKETGWHCDIPGSRCVADCGDGYVVGKEQCDSKYFNSSDTLVANEGCDDNCHLIEGKHCPSSGDLVDGAIVAGQCIDSVCGNGTREGLEGCDQENNDLGDGCTPMCELEPDCSAGACTSKCGDGMRLISDEQEECDDGNIVAGDGCDAECKIEVGYTCELIDDSASEFLKLPIVYRDFNGQVDKSSIHFESTDPYPSTRHPDFQVSHGPYRGLLQQSMVDGKPAFNTACGEGCAITNAESFHSWYRDTPGLNATTVAELELRSETPENDLFQYTNPEFFPLDGIIMRYDHDADPNTPEVVFGDDHRYILDDDDETIILSDHNFHFTSEVRFWFEFDGEKESLLEFTGDDDLWVFVNNKLVVDLGGLHQPVTGSVTLNPDGTANEQTFFNEIYNGENNRPDIPNVDKIVDGLQLVPGKVYEIAVFHAERRERYSNYKLTLGNFSRFHSECESICGDGFVTLDEICDDSVNDGSYGKCSPGCLAPTEYCGDGTPNGDEACDDGTNTTTYRGTDADACAPGCKTPGYCGDGNIDSVFGETCDRGEGKNTGGYGGCNTDCLLGPRCGDGIEQADEDCDNGTLNGSSNCDLDCKIVAPPPIGGDFR